MGKEKRIKVSYKDNRGQKIVLTDDEVRKYISTDPNVTEKEVFMFLQISKYLQLNPFLHEIYLVKYTGSPAQYIVSYQALLERAEANPNFDGYETFIEGNEIPEIKAIAKIYRKDRSHPTVVEVKYKEAVKITRDKRTGEMRPMSMWKNMPTWMLRKVALARALKEAFPTAMGNATVGAEGVIDTASKKPVTPEEAINGVNDIYGTVQKDEPTVQPGPPRPPIVQETKSVTVLKEAEKKEKEKIEEMKADKKPATTEQLETIIKLCEKTGKSATEYLPEELPGPPTEGEFVFYKGFPAKRAEEIIKELKRIQEKQMKPEYGEQLDKKE